MLKIHTLIFAKIYKQRNILVLQTNFFKANIEKSILQNKICAYNSFNTPLLNNLK